MARHEFRPRHPEAGRPVVVDDGNDNIRCHCAPSTKPEMAEQICAGKVKTTGLSFDPYAGVVHVLDRCTRNRVA